MSYQKSIGNQRSMSKDNGSESGSLRGHHIGQRSSSEVHIESNTATQHHQQQPHLNQQSNQAVNQGIVHGSQQQFQHHSTERRSAGSGGSGSMLGLPTQINSIPLSPLHSPLTNTRNYHQSFHQLPRPGVHRSEYHHHLPAIPIQGPHSLIQSSSSIHGSPQLKVRAHYGSLPINSQYEDEDYVENMTPRASAGRTTVMHRSRERMCGNNFINANMSSMNITSNFGGPTLPPALANSYGQSLSVMTPFGGQQYGAALPPPLSPSQLASNPQMQQQSHLGTTNGWSSNSANGNEFISPGVTFFDPI